MMYASSLFDFIPLWGLFLGTIAVVILAIEVGFLAGKRKRSISDESDKTSISAMVGASLGLLAFMLAFTFNTASTRFEQRRLLIQEDVNILSTCHMRASLLPEPFRTEFHKLLRESVNIRIEGAKASDKSGLLIKIDRVHDKLWQLAIELGEKEKNSGFSNLFISSLNDIFSCHGKRVAAALNNRIPETIWLTLYFVTIFSMCAMGYYAGLTGRRSFTVSILLAMSFTMVLTLIADLDRPMHALVRVSPQSTIELREKMDMLSLQPRKTPCEDSSLQKQDPAN